MRGKVIQDKRGLFVLFARRKQATFSKEEFQAICSRCHALPDPRIHTAKDWPAVFLRMEGNIQRMKVRGPTQEQTGQILTYLQEVARVSDGPAEPASYVFMGFGPAGRKDHPGQYEAVTISMAKKKGTNATHIAERAVA